MFGQLVHDSRNVHWHAHNVSKTHANGNLLFLDRRAVANHQQGFLKFGHEQTVGRRQGHDIGPAFRSRQYFSHFNGKPIAVAVFGVFGLLPSVLGSLVQFAHDGPGRDIPQTVVLMMVPLAQAVVGGSANG